MKQMKNVAVSHSDPEVLEACSKTYSCLSNENQTGQSCQVSLAKKELIKQLVDTYSQMLDDVLQEVSHIVLRIHWTWLCRTRYETFQTFPFI